MVTFIEVRHPIFQAYTNEVRAIVSIVDGNETAAHALYFPWDLPDELALERIIPKAYGYYILRDGEVDTTGVHTKIFLYNTQRIEVSFKGVPREYIGIEMNENQRFEAFRIPRSELRAGRYVPISPADKRDDIIKMPEFLFGWRAKMNS